MNPDYIRSKVESMNKQKLSNEALHIKAKYYEKDPFFGSHRVDMDSVFNIVADRIPERFLNYVDTIIVGSFAFLSKKELDAAYMDGSIYIANDSAEDTIDVVDDIIHETAHAVEQNNLSLIYGDGLIEQEFLGKRERLSHLLRENGFSNEVEYYDFANPDYDEQMDIFLYQEVTYSLLGNLTSGLFLSPYGVTSLREYFANAFEHYFLSSDKKEVFKISPSVAQKIEELLQND